MARFSLGGHDDDNTDVGASNSTSRAPLTKRRRTGLPPITHSEANVSAATVQENDNIEELHLGEDNDDTEGVDEEHNQSEGDQESENEGSKDGEGEEDGGDEENDTDQEDDGSEAVDDRNQGLAIGGGDMVSNDVSSGNSSGSLGIKSMLGTFSDPDVLDCPVCYEPLIIPVFQCENGHLACSSCCIMIGNKCPSCSWPIGYNRCRSIERILESVKFSCPNLEYGCKETMLYSKREQHENACEFSPCSCPVESCDFVGSQKKLYAHCRGRHLSSITQFDFKRPFKFVLQIEDRSVVFQEKTDGTIFILNHSNNLVPRAISLLCIGALHSGEQYYYELSVGFMDSTLQLKSFCPIIPKWSANQPVRKYLHVPSEFVYSGDAFVVTANIEKRRGS